MVQVRNLCYMVSRREKLKLLQSKAQEQMFNLHMTLINQELSAGESFISLPVRVSKLRAPLKVNPDYRGTFTPYDFFCSRSHNYRIKFSKVIPR